MRLGLIAMSGVRVQDEELVRVGLTLPAFVERSRVIASLPSLGLLTLAALAPPEVDLRYVEVDDYREDDDLPGEFDAVAVSSYSARIRDAYALADRYRAAGTKVILGGLHVTAVPDEAAAHADAVVLGDGEPLWPALLADLAGGTLRPRYDARGTPFDLARSPLPRYDLLDPERYNRLTVQTQRGCPWDCEFCAASLRLAPGYRLKPVELVVRDVRTIKSVWSHPFVELADDNTFANKSHAKELLRALARENIRWFTETDVSVAYDPELVELLGDSGCAQLLIGLESASAAGPVGVERKADWKARQRDRYREAIATLQDHGVTVNGCFVLGLDGSGVEAFDEVLEFVRDSGLYEVQATVLTPFPGTPLYERLRRTGRLLSPDAWERCTLFDVNFRPEGMDAPELAARFRSLLAALYEEGFVEGRRRRFRERLRRSRRPCPGKEGNAA